ncbi:MAG: hypothetical protein V2B18_07550 [Pseudomonadota bacterium]
MSESRECVGCGYCCRNTICRLGSMIYGHYKAPCPALEWSGNRYVCGVYFSDPLRYEHILGIGSGCCFPSNPLRENVAQLP